MPKGRSAIPHALAPALERALARVRAGEPALRRRDFAAALRTTETMKHRKLQSLLAGPAAGRRAVACVALARNQPRRRAVVGDAARGKPLFADTFNCYACHGFDAQAASGGLCR